MPILVLLTYLVTFGGLALIILVVAAKNYQTRINRWFILFSLSVLFFVVASFASELPRSMSGALFWTRAALFVADIIPICFHRFTLAFIGDKTERKWLSAAILGSTLGLLAVAYSPLTIVSALRNFSGTTIGQTGPFLWLTLIYFVIVFSISFRALHMHARVSDQSVKLQVRLMIYGIGFAVVLSLVTQIALPEFHISQYGNLVGMPSLILLVGSVGYAILRHHLFDVKAVILRSLGYLLMISLVSFLYGSMILVISKLLLPGLQLTVLEDSFFVAIAVVFTLIFHPILQFVSKSTDKIFFRDHYDSKHLLHRISKVLASEIEMPKLCWQVVTVLRGVVRVNQVDIIVLENGKAFYEVAGIFRKILPKFVQEMELIGDKTIVTDELAEDERKAILRKYGISVFAVIKDRNEKIGYLLFSEKNSGALFNKADVQVIDTIADTLAVAIQNSRAFTQIQQFNATLQAKIDKATEELHAANDKLKAADAIKDDFISMASHQLSTPLAVIDGYLSMANEGYYGKLSDKVAGPIKSALGRTQIMKGLVADLLNISRMTAGKFFLELTPTNLNEMAPDEVEQLQNQAKEMSVKLTYHAPHAPVPIVDADDQKISQSMMNLINNALHYAKNGVVDVYLESNDTDITFKVIDNGMGVPEDQKASLFTKFFRADNARKESPNGTGIGLYLVKRVVEDHNGKVIFSSQIGKGSTFGFTLPIHPGKLAGQISSDKSSN